MTFAKTLVFAIAILGLMGASVANAQTGYVAVYFDRFFTQEQMNCPGPIADSLYIAAVNWDMFVSGVQFAVNYPGTMNWLGDFDQQPVFQGNTPSGFAQGWATPQNGFQPIYVCGATIIWNCDDCTVVNDPIQVVDHPFLGPVAATRWPDNTLVPGIGLTGLVCPTIPTEETTWGGVKALYQND